MTDTTHPSSTPITAEGAVTILRDALQFFIDRCDSGLARSKTTYAKFKEVLAATDPAAIQPAGEAVYFVQHAGSKSCYEWTEVKAERFSTFVDGAFNTRVLYTLRAPQDAKAEQVVIVLTSEEVKIVLSWLPAWAKHNWHTDATASLEAKLRAPAASNVEAVSEWTAEDQREAEHLKSLEQDDHAALARQSAPIEAGEQNSSSNSSTTCATKPESVTSAPDDLLPLLKFYAVDSLEALARIQDRHIARLQAKLPSADQAAFTRVREG